MVLFLTSKSPDGIAIKNRNITTFKEYIVIYSEGIVLTWEPHLWQWRLFESTNKYFAKKKEKKREFLEILNKRHQATQHNLESRFSTVPIIFVVRIRHFDEPSRQTDLAILLVRSFVRS